MWLLVYMIFDVSGGGMELKMQATKPFPTEAACNAAGRKIGAENRLEDENLRSISICVSQSAFDA